MTAFCSSPPAARLRVLQIRVHARRGTAVTNDAKLGMLAGVAAVVVVAVVYFQKPPASAAAGKPAAVGTTTTPPAVPPAAVVVPQKGPSRG
jgi:hypothetical protein